MTGLLTSYYNLCPHALLSINYIPLSDVGEDYGVVGDTERISVRSPGQGAEASDRRKNSGLSGGDGGSTLRKMFNFLMCSVC